MGQALVPVACAAGLVLVPPGAAANAGVVAGLAQEHRPTHVVCTVPALLREYLLELARRGGAPPSLRVVSVGGDKLLPELAELAWRTLPGLAKLDNAYGGRAMGGRACSGGM